MDAFVVIAPSIITGLVSLAICIITQITARRENIAIMEKKMAVFETKFDNLAEKVSALTQKGYDDRITDLERITDVQAEQIKVINHRLDDLEHEHKKNHYEQT